MDLVDITVELCEVQVYKFFYGDYRHHDGRLLSFSFIVHLMQALSKGLMQRQGTYQCSLGEIQTIIALGQQYGLNEDSHSSN